MTLAEFRELTKDLSGDLTLCASAGNGDHDEDDLFECLPVEAIFGLDLVETGESDFIELFIPTQEA